MVSKKGVSLKGKRLPKAAPLATRKASGGPIESVDVQNTLNRDFRSDMAKRKNQPVPEPIPPQPFSSPVGDRNPV